MCCKIFKKGLGRQSLKRFLRDSQLLQQSFITTCARRPKESGAYHIQWSTQIRWKKDCARLPSLMNVNFVPALDSLPCETDALINGERLLGIGAFCKCRISASRLSSLSVSAQWRCKYLGKFANNSIFILPHIVNWTQFTTNTSDSYEYRKIKIAKFPY